jgi:hypothetical protein
MNGVLSAVSGGAEERAEQRGPPFLEVVIPLESAV